MHSWTKKSKKESNKSEINLTFRRNVYTANNLKRMSKLSINCWAKRGNSLRKPKETLTSWSSKREVWIKNPFSWPKEMKSLNKRTNDSKIWWRIWFTLKKQTRTCMLWTKNGKTNTRISFSSTKKWLKSWINSTIRNRIGRTWWKRR